MFINCIVFLCGMDPHTHFLFPFVIGVIFVELGVFTWPLAILAGVVGMLIDVDHYVENIVHSKKNRFSLRAAWNNAVKYHRFNQRSFIHYGIGVLILTGIFMVVAVFSWKIALAVAIGYYSHIILDYSHLKNEEHFRWKLGSLYMKEQVGEAILDVFLVALLVLVLFF